MPEALHYADESKEIRSVRAALALGRCLAPSSPVLFGYQFVSPLVADTLVLTGQHARFGFHDPPHRCVRGEVTRALKALSPPSSGADAANHSVEVVTFAARRPEVHISCLQASFVKLGHKSLCLVDVGVLRGTLVADTLVVVGQHLCAGRIPRSPQCPRRCNRCPERH